MTCSNLKYSNLEEYSDLLARNAQKASKTLRTHDCAFYFKRFTIDDEKQVAKRIFLRFERIASHATVWLNGKLLGTHFGAYTPFIIELQKALKLGEENVLCVRVANMGALNSRIDFGRESADGADDRFVHPGELPVGLPWTQYPFGGIFGHVDLILGTAAFISDVKLEPDADTQRIACEISFNNPRGFQTRLRVLMRNPDGDVYEQSTRHVSGIERTVSTSMSCSRLYGSTLWLQKMSRRLLLSSLAISGYKVSFIVKILVGIKGATESVVLIVSHARISERSTPV